MERDDEVKGSGNSLDFGNRIYDSRLGRWLSTDPDEKNYAGWSPYTFCLNNPILFLDPDGNNEKLSKLFFQNIWNNYIASGSMVLDKVKEKGDDKLEQFRGQNSCAIKLSNSLNQSGFLIPHPKLLPKGVNAVTTKKSGNFIYRANEMNTYLNKEYGSPDESFSVTPSNAEEVYKNIIKHQGIISMLATNPLFGANGHADLIGDDPTTPDVDVDLYGSKGHLLAYLQGLGTEANPAKVDIWNLSSIPKKVEEPKKEAPKKESFITRAGRSISRFVRRILH